jgi:L-asparaginase
MVMASENLIHFIITGGTIDSYYDPAQDKIVPHKESIIPNYIKSLKLSIPTEFEVICMKDSRNLDEQDLKNILQAVEKSKALRVIITHGTYTVADTARYIKANLKRTDQAIVLTSSMLPITGFSPTDGPFNIGYSLAQVQNLQPGIYLSLGGSLYDPEDVMKLIGEGRFISLISTEK